MTSVVPKAQLMAPTPINDSEWSREADVANPCSGNQKGQVRAPRMEAGEEGAFTRFIHHGDPWEQAIPTQISKPEGAHMLVHACLCAYKHTRMQKGVTYSKYLDCLYSGSVSIITGRGPELTADSKVPVPRMAEGRSCGLPGQTTSWGLHMGNLPQGVTSPPPRFVPGHRLFTESKACTSKQEGGLVRRDHRCFHTYFYRGIYYTVSIAILLSKYGNWRNREQKRNKSLW